MDINGIYPTKATLYSCFFCEKVCVKNAFTVPEKRAYTVPNPQESEDFSEMNARNESGNGFLRVRVTEANGTLPVAGASVRITEYPAEDASAEGMLLYSMRTDRDGLTPLVSLPAPPVEDSLKPGSAQPYALYNISVTYDGYYPVENVGIPIFDRITAVQPVNLLPFTEGDRIAGADNGRVMIYETPGTTSLQPGGLTREDIGGQNGTVTGGVRNSRPETEPGGADEQ